MDNFSQIEQRIADLERSVNDTLDTVHPDTSLSVLWLDFTINVGRFLLNLCRNFRAWFSISDQLTLQEVFDQARSEQRTLSMYTMQEAIDGLRMMVNARPSMSDYQPEECSFTQYNDDGFALVLPVEEQ